MTLDFTGAKLACQTLDTVRQRRIEADFSGSAITSNAGILLAGLAERRLNLFDRLGDCFLDTRNQDMAVHSCRSLAGQRVLGLLLGCENLSDHEELRKDPAIGAVLGCIEPRHRDCQPLAGKSTLNRFEMAACQLGLGDKRIRRLRPDGGKV